MNENDKKQVDNFSEYREKLERMKKILEDCDDQEINPDDLRMKIDSINSNFDLFNSKNIFPTLRKSLKTEFSHFKISGHNNQKHAEYEIIKEIINRIHQLCGQQIIESYMSSFSNEAYQEEEKKFKEVTENADKAEQIIKEYPEVLLEFPNELSLWKKDSEYVNKEKEIFKKLENKDEEIRRTSAEAKTMERLTTDVKDRSDKFKILIRKLKNPLKKAQIALRKKGITDEEKKEIRQKLEGELKKQGMDIKLLNNIFGNNKKEKVEEEIRFEEDKEGNGRDYLLGSPGTLLGFPCRYNKFTSSLDLEIKVNDFEKFLKKTQGKRLHYEYRSFNLIIENGENNSDKINIPAGCSDGNESEDEDALNVKPDNNNDDENEDGGDDGDESGLEGFDSDDEREDDQDNLHQAEFDFGDNTIDSAVLLKFLPITLTNFSFKYFTKNVNLDQAFNLKALVRGLIYLGVQYYTFHNISFADGQEQNPNVECFKGIFQESRNYSSLKYLNFYECEEIWKLDDVFRNLEKLETLSLGHCHLHDEDLEKVKDLLAPFKRFTLNTLNLSHNKIKNNGFNVINAWVNGEDRSLNIRKINLHNNSLKDPQNPQDGPSQTITMEL